MFRNFIINDPNNSPEDILANQITEELLALNSRMNALIYELSHLDKSDPDYSENKAMIKSKIMEIHQQSVYLINKIAPQKLSDSDMQHCLSYKNAYSGLLEMIHDDTPIGLIRIRLRNEIDETDHLSSRSTRLTNEDKYEGTTIENEINVELNAVFSFNILEANQSQVFVKPKENHLDIDLKYIIDLGLKIFSNTKGISLEYIHEITQGLCLHNIYQQIQSNVHTQETMVLMRQWRLLLESIHALSKLVVYRTNKPNVDFQYYWLTGTLFHDLVQLKFNPSTEDKPEDMTSFLSIADAFRYDPKSAARFIREVESDLGMINQKIQLMTTPLLRHNLLRLTPQFTHAPVMIQEDRKENSEACEAVKSEENHHKKTRIIRR